MSEYADCPAEYDDDYKCGYLDGKIGEPINDDYDNTQPNYKAIVWERTGWFDGYKDYLKENNND